MKSCFKCDTEKPLSEFYKHKAMADGHLNKCKSCTRFDAWRFRHLEGRHKVISYDRERAKNPNRREKSKSRTQIWVENFPERKKAQTAVSNAIRDGRMIRWPVCCMPFCEDKPEAHHPDYSKPLDVVWLCVTHHKEVHNMEFLKEK